MLTFADLKPHTRLQGLLPHQTVTLLATTAVHPTAVRLTYRTDTYTIGQQTISAEQLAHLAIAPALATGPFSQEVDTFKVTAEAYRLQLGYLFDPVLAVHSSLVMPLPHQITAVYEQMLNRHPLRYLLADDPGSGKTIMAGLLIKELILRDDAKRCLICVPGSLANQWQEELRSKFQLYFDIFTPEPTLALNPFSHTNRLIIRLDQAARSEQIQTWLEQTDWDLTIVDEAHKMSASFWNNDIRKTNRYRLGELLGSISRHFLLMTATPHNGKEEDFQLFLQLIDRDRFENRSKSAKEPTDISDIMRRMIKEDLRHFDGRPLFPERRSYTLGYELSAEEEALYEAVTDYVRTQFDQAERLQNKQQQKTVGFALTVLQRRLASSPKAIYESLQRRHQRLQQRLQESTAVIFLPTYDWLDEVNHIDQLEELGSAESETIQENLIDQATAARTTAELKAEIAILAQLSEQAHHLYQQGNDRKWQEMVSLLQADHWHRQRQKLVIFTEYRDTLHYLRQRIATFLGDDGRIAYIDGQLSRAQRQKMERRFLHDPNVDFLLATDAAGEGINLQKAHLMINYDLPWNPNRLEQRFGRIHRIGQKEICHLWNLVAKNTREGQVYARLLQKLASESKALNGRVFDILGQLFDEKPLSNLLMEAVRHGSDPAQQQSINQAIDTTVDQQKISQLLKSGLATDSLDLSKIGHIRANMERHEAHRLQPHHAQKFFEPMFTNLGGTLHKRAYGRFDISYVPHALRQFVQANGLPPIQNSYPAVCFDKQYVDTAEPEAELLALGHPLVDGLIAYTLAHHHPVLQQGAVLLDANDTGNELRYLYWVEQYLHDADGRVLDKRVDFVEVCQGEARSLTKQIPSYMDYKAVDTSQWELLQAKGVLTTAVEHEPIVQQYAEQTLLPHYLAPKQAEQQSLAQKRVQAVTERLRQEINYWDRRANELQEKIKQGQTDLKEARRKAQQWADELERRLEAGRQSQQLTDLRPLVAIVGRALIVPQGFFADAYELLQLNNRKQTEMLAMQAVMAQERANGYQPTDVHKQNLGYDIESLDPQTGHLRFIEVKGHTPTNKDVSVTYNEHMVILNKGEHGFLAVVEVANGRARTLHYFQRPFDQQPARAAASTKFNILDLLKVTDNIVSYRIHSQQ